MVDSVLAVLRVVHVADADADDLAAAMEDPRQCGRCGAVALRPRTPSSWQQVGGKQWFSVRIYKAFIYNIHISQYRYRW